MKIGIMASQISGHLTPTSPVAGYTAWFDASNTASITSSAGAVSQWNDLSGNGYNLTQSTATNKPTTASRTQNSLNLIDFDGSNDYMINSSTKSVWTFLHYTTATIFWALLPDVSGFASVIDTNNHGQTNTTRGIDLFQRTSSGIGATVTNGNGTASYLVSDLTSASFFTAASFYYASCVYDNANGTASDRLKIRFKTNAAITGNTQTGTPSSSDYTNTYFNVGVNQAQEYFLNGAIGEILIYNTVLSNANITLNNTYLANKWGV